jgi:hypothetical protein
VSTLLQDVVDRFMTDDPVGREKLPLDIDVVVLPIARAGLTVAREGLLKGPPLNSVEVSLDPKALLCLCIPVLILPLGLNRVGARRG